MKKFVALLRTPEKEYYIQYFRSMSKRDIVNRKKNPSDRIEAVLDYNEKNNNRLKHTKQTLNRLNGYA